MISFSKLHAAYSKIRCKNTARRQRALTPSEELDGRLASAVPVLHITGIIPQVLLLQRVDSQGNGHFLFTEVLFDNPATQNKQKKHLVNCLWDGASSPFFSYVLCTTTCNQCNWMWWQAACIWFVLIVRASITKHVVLQLRETNKGSVAPPYAARTRTELTCVLLLRTSRYVNFLSLHTKHMRNENQ